jgi:hypothetical protein
MPAKQSFVTAPRIGWVGWQAATAPGSVIWVDWRISCLLPDLSAKQIMNADRGDGGCDLEASG